MLVASPVFDRVADEIPDFSLCSNKGLLCRVTYLQKNIYLKVIKNQLLPPVAGLKIILSFRQVFAPVVDGMQTVSQSSL